MHVLHTSGDLHSQHLPLHHPPVQHEGNTRVSLFPQVAQGVC